jgi:hypothetical protein
MTDRVISLVRAALVLASAALILPANAQPVGLPEPSSGEFCQVVQQILANTEMVSNNTVFKDMPEYRHSKPSPNPLMTYQVVTYDGQMPIMVSCKIKGAAQIRSEYGEDAAGEQQYCPTIARMVKAEAIAELKSASLTEALSVAESFVIDENEPFMTGRDYLSDFELSYVGEDGAIHFNSPGLFQDYDSWAVWILPEKFEGQTYCHLATVEYMTAVATGQIEPGTVMTTADDAPVQPH